MASGFSKRISVGVFLCWLVRQVLPLPAGLWAFTNWDLSPRAAGQGLCWPYDSRIHLHREAPFFQVILWYQQWHELCPLKDVKCLTSATKEVVRRYKPKNFVSRSFSLIQRQYLGSYLIRRAIEEGIEVFAICKYLFLTFKFTFLLDCCYRPL